MTNSRQYIAAVLGLVAGYLLAVAAAELPGLSRPVRIAAAAFAVIAFAVFLVTEIRMVRGLDELQRRIQLEALAIAFPTALLLVFALGMLERAGVTIWGFRSLRDVWPLLILPYGVGLVLAIRRYR